MWIIYAAASIQPLSLANQPATSRDDDPEVTIHAQDKD